MSPKTRQDAPRKTSQSAPDFSAGPPRLLDVKQAAGYLSCSVWFARGIAWSNACKHVKLGKKILFDKSDLDAYIDRMKEAA
jgi:excisionase family DNA binding protein